MNFEGIILIVVSLFTHSLAVAVVVAGHGCLEIATAASSLVGLMMVMVMILMITISLDNRFWGEVYLPPRLLSDSAAARLLILDQIKCERRCSPRYVTQLKKNSKTKGIVFSIYLFFETAIQPFIPD